MTPATKIAPSPALATLDGVSLRLGSRSVLSHVSLRLEPGEVVALVGPNGAGKSSLLKVLAGLIAPTAGHATFSGVRISDMRAADLAAGVAYLPQARAIHWPLPVRAIVALGRLPHQMRGQTTPQHDDAAIAAAMGDMEVADFAERPVLALSGGEQARVLLARALAQEPRLLIADEPTAGLDLGHQLALMQGLRSRARTGSSSIVALHDLALAARYADRVLLLAEGQMVAAGPPADVLTSARIAAVYGVDMLVTHVDGLPVFVPRGITAG